MTYFNPHNIKRQTIKSVKVSLGDITKKHKFLTVITFKLYATNSINIVITEKVLEQFLINLVAINKDHDLKLKFSKSKKNNVLFILNFENDYLYISLVSGTPYEYYMKIYYKKIDEFISVLEKNVKKSNKRKLKCLLNNNLTLEKL